MIIIAFIILKISTHLFEVVLDAVNI